MQQNVGNDKSCRNVVAQLNKLQMTQINSCANQLGFTTTKERLKKSTVNFPRFTEMFMHVSV